MIPNNSRSSRGDVEGANNFFLSFVKRSRMRFSGSLIFLIVIMFGMMMMMGICIHGLQLEDLLNIRPSSAIGDSNQILEDANCTIATIEKNNNEFIYPLLKEIVVCVVSE